MKRILLLLFLSVSVSAHPVSIIPSWVYEDFTEGSVLFSDSNGVPTEDNTGFYWDDANNYLGINTNSPTCPLTMVQSGVTPEDSAIGSAYHPKMLSVQGDGGAYLMGRDVTNNIEFMFGTSVSGAAFVGSMTSHPLYLRTGNSNRFTISAAGDCDIPSGRLTVTDSGFPVSTIERTTTATTGYASAFAMDTITSNNMADTFGGSMFFRIQDSGTGGKVPAARLGYVREDGNDLKYSLTFCTNDGTHDVGDYGLPEVMRMGYDGTVDVINDFTAGTIQADNGVSGTLELDDGSTEKITLVFTGGVLTSRTVGATTGSTLADWTD